MAITRTASQQEQQELTKEFEEATPFLIEVATGRSFREPRQTVVDEGSQVERNSVEQTHMAIIAPA